MSKTVLHQILDRSGFSPVTRNKYAGVIDRWIDFAGADPSGWTRDKAQEFYDQLVEGGVKPQSANTYLASLRYVSKWYATKTSNPDNDFALVQKRRGKKRDVDDEDDAPILDESEATRLIQACNTDGQVTLVDRRDRTMFILALETGMRRMSLKGAEVGNMNVRRGYPAIKVPIKGDGGTETFNVPLSDTAGAILNDLIADLRRHKVRDGAIFRRIKVKAGHKGFDIDGGLSDTAINEIVAKRAAAAGLRHVNPHMFRHTFISWRNQAGLSPFDVAAITGHKVTAVAFGGMQVHPGAMQTYIHRDVNQIRNSTPDWLRDLVAQLLG